MTSGPVTASTINAAILGVAEEWMRSIRLVPELASLMHTEASRTDGFGARLAERLLQSSNGNCDEALAILDGMRREPETPEDKP